MKIRYLFDENMNPRFRTTLHRHYHDIDALLLGENQAPTLGTADDQILHFLECTQRVLVTDNRRSMPLHVRSHLAAGHHHWGIFIVRKDAAFKSLSDALFVYWEVTEAEQWVDVIEWVNV